MDCQVLLVGRRRSSARLTRLIGPDVSRGMISNCPIADDKFHGAWWTR